MLAGLALVVFAAASVTISIVDARRRRIPNLAVLAFTAPVFALLAVASDWGSPERPLSAAGGALAAFALLLVPWLVRSGGIGGGDVKLSPLVGGVLGYFGSWAAVFTGFLLAFAAAAAWGAALKLRRSGAGAPFAPCLFAGAWCGLFCTM